MAATIGHLQRLSAHGVGFHSFTEEHLSTDNKLVRNILLATLASLAKLEREKINQRTKAGLERARAMGAWLGRPKFSDGDREKLRAALDRGDSWHAVSQATKSPTAVKKHARAMGYRPLRPTRRKIAMVKGYPLGHFVSALSHLKTGRPFDCKVDYRFYNTGSHPTISTAKKRRA